MTHYNPLENIFQLSGFAAAARMASVRWSDGGQIEQAVISKIRVIGMNRIAESGCSVTKIRGQVLKKPPFLGPPS